MSIFSRGKRMSAACFSGVTSVTLTWKKPSAGRCCIPRCVWLHLESKTLLPKDSFFPLACRASANFPYTPVYASGRAMHVSQAGEVFPWWLLLLENVTQTGMFCMWCCSRYWPFSVPGRKALSTGTARTQHKNLQCCVNAGPLFIAPQSVQTSVTGFYMTLGYILTWINGKCFFSEHLGLYFI